VAPDPEGWVARAKVNELDCDFKGGPRDRIEAMGLRPDHHRRV
jgi:hypothetical protein